MLQQDVVHVVDAPAQPPGMAHLVHSSSLHLDSAAESPEAYRNGTLTTTVVAHLADERQHLLVEAYCVRIALPSVRTLTDEAAVGANRSPWFAHAADNFGDCQAGAVQTDASSLASMP